MNNVANGYTVVISHSSQQDIPRAITGHKDKDLGKAALIGNGSLLEEVHHHDENGDEGVADVQEKSRC